MAWGTSVPPPAEIDAMLDDLQTRSMEMFALTPVWVRKPGEWLWQWLELYSPATAEWLAGGAAEPGAAFLAVLAAACWLAGLLLLIGLWRIGRTTLRASARLAAVVRFRLAIGLANLRTRIVCRLRRLSRHSRESHAIHEQVELDELDLAVLWRGAMLAPGFALSVSEVAEQLRRRPAQVQRSLDKLHEQQLVNPLLGSTDGYGNYCLTDSGAWYMAAYQRAGGASGRQPPLRRG